MRATIAPLMMLTGIAIATVGCGDGGDTSASDGTSHAGGGGGNTGLDSGLDAEQDADPGYATTCVTFCAAGSCEMDCSKETGSLEVGDLCFGLESEVQCKEGLACYGDRCVRTCTAERYCLEEETCHPLGNIAYCTLPNVGQYCTTHNECAGGTRCVQAGPDFGECAFLCSAQTPCESGECYSSPYGENYCV